MLQRNKKKINSVQIGDLVLLSTVFLDRNTSDAPNVLCFVMDRKRDKFQLGCQVAVNYWNDITASGNYNFV